MARILPLVALVCALLLAPLAQTAPDPGTPDRGTPDRGTPGRGTPEPGEEGAARARAAGITLPAPAPDRAVDDASGPFGHLVIRNVMLVDGEGAPPRGPVDIHVREGHIDAISAPAATPPASADRIIDGTGMYALPGFIDAHVHIGTPFQGLAGPLTPAEYVFKLWLAHGITTVREVGSTMGLGWTVAHAERSARGAITAPRIVPFSMFPGSSVTDAEGATRWVQAVRKRGAQGVKLRGGTRAALEAVYAESARLGMPTANHHDQTAVYQINALDSARMGLTSLEHWYGLPEALFTDRTLQDYPPDYNYADEQDRFGQAGRLWLQAAPPGSERWNSVRDELIARDLTLVPTFTIYEANRDLARARDVEWHDAYTWPALRRFFMPDPRLHGSYHFDWTTADEVAWRRNFERWMTFVNDYKNAGGRVATGSDAGFIFKLFGFAYVRELELLQEAGFHPLEVIQAATLNGATLLGMADEIGSLVPGKRADIVLVGENPVANFKVLYGTGHMRLNRDSGRVERVGGVRWTIRDGIVFDAPGLLADVRRMVAHAREADAEGSRSESGSGRP
ncbi:MAG: amidohydrolase family protein [Pseudomonadales bacterium]|jgi:imidazolonepropionase-like amidohydrolase|nr:amidohydrolase family protein [Pseudomonadales bacterium]